MAVSFQAKNTYSDITTNTALFEIVKHTEFQKRIVPYKPVFDDETQRWILRRSTFAQIASIVFIWSPFWIGMTAELVQDFYSLKGAEKRNSATYFTFLIACMIYIMNLIQFWTAFQRTSQVEKILNQIYFGDLFTLEPETVKHGSIKFVYLKYFGFIYAISIFFARFSIHLAYVFGEKTKDLRANNSAPDIFFKFVQASRERYFLPEIDRVDGYENYCLGILEIWIDIVYLIRMIDSDSLYFGTIPVTLWLATLAFNKSVVTGLEKKFYSRIVFQRVVLRYEELKRFSASLNSIYSVAFLFKILVNFLVVVFRLNYELSIGNPRLACSMLVLVFHEMAAIFLSAEVFRMMTCFKSVLLEEHIWGPLQYSDAKTEITRVKFDLDTDPIGIGSCGLFKLTYEFATQLSVVGITIFLISFDD